MGLVAMKCPGCGADIELDDSREFGFCTFCGTKVMQEKIVVEHQGSVKVDNSEYVEKCLQNARRALKKEDWDEVEKYYNLVEQNVPDNIEAVFFSAYGKTMSLFTSKEVIKREQNFQVLINSMSIISDCYETTKENKIEVLKKIKEYIYKMFSATVVYDFKQISSIKYKNQVIRCNAIWHQYWLYKVLEAFVRELSEIGAAGHEDEIKQIRDGIYLNERDPIDAYQRKQSLISACFIALSFLIAIICFFSIFK